MGIKNIPQDRKFFSDQDKQGRINITEIQNKI